MVLRCRRLSSCLLVLGCISAPAAGSESSLSEAHSSSTVLGLLIDEGNIPFRSQDALLSSDGLSWKRGDDYFDYDYYYGDYWDLDYDYDYDGTMFDYGNGYDYYYLDYYYLELGDPLRLYKEALLEQGEVPTEFQCRGNANLGKLFVDPSFVDTRRLHLAITYYYWDYFDYGHDSWWNNPFGEGGDVEDYDDEPAPDVVMNIKEFRVYDLAYDLKPLPAFVNNGVSPKWVAPSAVMRISTPKQSVVVSEGYVDTGMALEYDCLRVGQAVVELWLTIQAQGKADEHICLNWLKHCAIDLPFLAMEDGEFNDIVYNSEVMPGAQFFKSPVQDEISFFYMYLKMNGLMRLKIPEVWVDGGSNVGSVDVRFEDMENPFLEVDRWRTRMTVDYWCAEKGVMLVSMALQRDMSHARITSELQWHKYCEGPSQVRTHPNLNAFVYSTAKANYTLAVRHGEAQPGFLRPCPKSASSRIWRQGAQHNDQTVKNKATAGCHNKVPSLLVPRSDNVTTIHWQWSSESEEFPRFYESVVGYDPRLMEAKIQNDWRKMKSTVKYVCFGEGVGNVTVTFYSRGFTPLDFSWRKDCSKPKIPVRGGPGATSWMPLVVSVSIFIVLTCCIVCFMVCIRRRARKEKATDTEIASLVGKRAEFDDDDNDAIEAEAGKVASAAATAAEMAAAFDDGEDEPPKETHGEVDDDNGASTY